MGEPLPVDLHGALTGFLSIYRERIEVVLVLEAVSNAIDAKAKNVRITLNKQKEIGHFYIKFADDGPGMNKDEFISYHTVSLSQKQKGEGIGFVGVGAKIYLASRDGSEILTVSRNGANNIFASKMYRKNTSIEHDTSLNLPLELLCCITESSVSMV
jgi:sensor histidine kinase regulating citrate/malate metabolism